MAERFNRDSGETDLVVIGLHCYQPLRFASHPDLAGINMSPDGINWTQRITKESYKPLFRAGADTKFNLDIFASLRAVLPESLIKKIKEVMKERGVGDTYLHPILPDTSSRNRRILFAAGRNDFEDQCGRRPEWFWPPETALDTPTLVDAVKAGYKGVICAPEQIIRQDGRPADDTPVRLSLGDGDYILAFPFDRPVSGSLAFGQKNNADTFAEEVLARLRQLPDSDQQVMLAWTDGETFGHHHPGGVEFLEYLLKNSLPERGMHPISIYQALERLILDEIPTAKLIERSAWSCPHGNLARWNGECNCGGNGDMSWKGSFMAALRKVNSKIDQILDSELSDWEETLAEKFRHYLQGEFLEGKSTPQDYLLMAKASSLTGLTSCGTFFSEVHVSGNLNILFALQACLCLQSAGLTNQARVIQSEFYRSLEQITDAEGKNFAAIVDKIFKEAA